MIALVDAEMAALQRRRRALLKQRRDASHQVERLYRMRAAGKSLRECGAAFGMTAQAIHDALRNNPPPDKV